MPVRRCGPPELIADRPDAVDEILVGRHGRHHLRSAADADGDARPRRLVLWDIDGTLVDSAGLGREAFLEAVERVTGLRPTRVVPFAGRTDLEIAVDLLRTVDRDGDERLLERFGAALEEGLAARAAELRERGRALPGALESLRRLGRQPGLLQSVLTGNIAPNAALKLSSFGLDRHVDLEIGAYGSDHMMRGELVAVARRKAARKHGVEFPGKQVVLVGDTPLDIAAAREGGARAVGVATGPYDERALAEAGADAVLPDLIDTPTLLHAIEGG